MKAVLRDLEAVLDPEDMVPLRKINWSRQIRIPLLTYEDPEETQGIIDVINATFPEGINIPYFESI